MMVRMDEGMPFLLKYENVAWYDAGKVRILDRRIFPTEVRFVECATYQEVAQAIADTWDLTREKLERKFDACVTLPLCRVPAFKAQYLDGIMADSAGYAGTEIIRRTVGDSKVMEVSSVTDPEKRIPMERALIKLGIALIKNRSTFRRGRELTEAFRLILA